MKDAQCNCRESLRPLIIRFFILSVVFTGWLGDHPAAAAQVVQADLLVVGGTESGCAAAVQAARMGVERVVLVNDIKWLGGQFSAEGLGAIDENRAHGYDGSVPIPRSGIFREVVDAIEQRNARLYGGIRRPGNTRVITTSRPGVSESVFRELLRPYERTRQIRRFSNYRVQKVLVKDNHVQGVAFVSTEGKPALTVRAPLTIDASDWGDVIQGSGAAWDAGIDRKSEFGEPSAPEAGEPSTDMNPITWCMILQRQESKTLLPEPEGYDPRYFTGVWGWIDEEFAYTSRRLVDGRGFEEIDHPDVLLINTPPIDYPLDVYPADVAAALEATEVGASRKHIVAMTPQQREIVFRDARRHSLKFLYHLQQRFPKFQFMMLSDEFGTPDKLPPKPYIRESLRLKARHVVREQEVLGFGSRSSYASTMFPDAVFSWQFELDFHPTRRSWTTNRGDEGPWEATFRGNRRFGRGGTGRSVFPLRALVPNDIRGLLGAQKNLGYTSIVSSSCRLHDQSIHAGQASGAVAAVSLRHDEHPADFYLRPDRMAEIWNGLLKPSSGAPLVIWPFADVDPFDPGFAAIQQLALRRLLNLGPADISFEPDEPATQRWWNGVAGAIEQSGYDVSSLDNGEPPATRREAAMMFWDVVAGQPIHVQRRERQDDADGDGIVDGSDALPFTPGEISWQLSAEQDGIPEPTPPFDKDVLAFNFTSARGSKVDGFVKDVGALFNVEKGFGWRRDLSSNTRLRNVDDQPLRNGFVFTRARDVWECAVANGTWKVHLCLGDAEHDQPGQYLSIEQEEVARNIATAAGQFHEIVMRATVRDGRLTLTLGIPQGGSNTCINWMIIQPDESAPSRADQTRTLVEAAIAAGRLPGAVVCMADGEQIRYLQAFGDRQVLPTRQPMKVDTIFDLASITKPVATATSIMWLIDNEKIELDLPVSKYLPEFTGGGKEAITVGQLLLHTSGLIADNALADYTEGRPEAWKKICALSLKAEPGTKFIYSDVGYIVLGELVQRISRQSLDQFTDEHLFRRLGMTDTMFNPPRELRFRIAATEKRDGQWICGHVHDPRAFLMGGVAGHAGLFSTAEDLVRFGRMLLAADSSRESILSAETIALMTGPRDVFRGKRTPGWDHSSPYSRNGGAKRSGRAFGHGGFTGTVFWMDPETGMIFIFLSSRLHPDGQGEVNTLAGEIATIWQD